MASSPFPAVWFEEYCERRGAFALHEPVPRFAVSAAIPGSFGGLGQLWEQADSSGEPIGTNCAYHHARAASKGKEE